MTGQPRAAWMTLALLVAAVFPVAMTPWRDATVDLGAGAVAVRYHEGMVHGFLQLSTEAGALLAHGDLLQVPNDSGITSRMVFHFKDSVFEETVSFAQHDVFAMQEYHLVQSGPAFADDLDARLSRSGDYVVRTKSHKDGKEKTYTGTLALPPDTYNGMVVTVAKNISMRDATSIHIVAFTPEPRVIKLELEPSGTERVMIGKHEEAATRFAVKPELGAFLGLAARLTGKTPPDSRIWILTDDVPAFVKSEGPLYSGPVWRVVLASPVWSR